jgi:hypothetical protein
MSNYDRGPLLQSVLVISTFLRKRGIVLTAETQEELLLALEEGFSPEPNTKQEWSEFGKHWLDGGWMDMQWYDTSEGAVDEAEWYDFEEDDCFYPYDENLIMRFK